MRWYGASCDDDVTRTSCGDRFCLEGGECDKLPPVSGRKRVQRGWCCVQVMIAGVLLVLWSRVERGGVGGDGQHDCGAE